nr:hypothetical protein [Micromonospora provocatoris]
MGVEVGPEVAPVHLPVAGPAGADRVRQTRPGQVHPRAETGEVQVGAVAAAVTVAEQLADVGQAEHVR